MKWSTPQASDMRFGFEITMYIANRWSNQAHFGGLSLDFLFDIYYNTPMGTQSDYFNEKGKSNGPGFINAGFYKLTKSFFNDWNGNAFSIETNLFPILVKEKKLNCVISESEFIDIGIPEDYHKFCNRFKVY